MCEKLRKIAKKPLKIVTSTREDYAIVTFINPTKDLFESWFRLSSMREVLNSMHKFNYLWKKSNTCTLERFRSTEHVYTRC